MMMGPDPKKQYCRVRSAKSKGSRVKCESQAKEVFQARLKLPCEKALLSAAQGLLAEEEMGSSLLGLVSLRDQQVIVPLEDLTVLAGLGDSSLESSLLPQIVIESLMKMRPPLG
jgi:hypothetical protein